MNGVASFSFPFKNVLTKLFRFVLLLHKSINALTRDHRSSPFFLFFDVLDLSVWAFLLLVLLLLFMTKKNQRIKEFTQGLSLLSTLMAKMFLI